MNVAFIPVRGGSKSIPLKNIKPICGMPLVYWTVNACCGCPAIDQVYVATDSDRIRDTVQGFGLAKVEVISRSPETASDTASTESAMLEFAHAHVFDAIALVQATSPLLKAGDLNRGFAVFQESGTESVLSVVRQKRFHWAVDEQGLAKPTNYDVLRRPRRQEFDGYLVENGAFYITSRERLLVSGNRVSGRIKIVEMSADTFFEIDEPSDWIIIEALMRRNGIRPPKAPWPEIKMFLTDCDGCLTDGGMYYSEQGDELKKFNTRDGMGFSLLREKGIITGIITSESVELNRRRAKKLKLDILESGCTDKKTTVLRLCEKYGIRPENVAYMGDDLNDVEALKSVGLGICPADAQPCARACARMVTKARGGEGAVREAAEIILEGI